MTKQKQPLAILFTFALFLTLFFINLNFPAQAIAGTAFVDTAAVKSSMSLVPYSEYLADPKASLQIEELFLPEEAQNFKALSNGIPFTFSGSVWFRITLAPTSKPSPDGELVLDLGSNVPKGATLYYPVNSQEPGLPSVWQGRKPGSTYSLATASANAPPASVKLSPYQFKLPPANEVNPTTIYINVPGTPSAWFAPTVRTAEDAMRDKESVPLYFSMCLLGVFIALCLLRAFRDGGEWRLWTAVLGALILSQTLIDLPPMPKGQVPFSGLLNVLIPALSLALIPHIARHLFNTKTINKNFDYLWLYLSILGALAPVFALVPGYSWIIRILPLWPVLAILPGLFAIGAVVKKLPGAGKFMSSCFLLATCTLLSLLATTNAAPNSLFITTPLWGGSIFTLLVGILPLARKNDYNDMPQNVVDTKATGPVLSLGDVLDLGVTGVNNYNSPQEEEQREDTEFLLKSLHHSQPNPFSAPNLPPTGNSILNENYFEQAEDVISLDEYVPGTSNNLIAMPKQGPKQEPEQGPKQEPEQGPENDQKQAELGTNVMFDQPKMPPPKDETHTPAWALHLKNNAQTSTFDQSTTNERALESNPVISSEFLPSFSQEQTEMNNAPNIQNIAGEGIKAGVEQGASPSSDLENTFDATPHDTPNDASNDNMGKLWVPPTKEETPQTLDEQQHNLPGSPQEAPFTFEQNAEAPASQPALQRELGTKPQSDLELDEQESIPQTYKLSLPKDKDYVPAWARSTLANAKLKAEAEANAEGYPAEEAAEETPKDNINKVASEHSFSPEIERTEAERAEYPAAPATMFTQEPQAETSENQNSVWTPNAKPLDMAATPRPMPYPARSQALGKITHINSVLPIISVEDGAKEAERPKHKAPRVPMSPWAKTIAKEAMQLDATSLGKIEECLKVPLEALVQAASELSTCSLPPLARQRSEAIIKSSQVLSELVNTLTSAPNEPLEMVENESNEDAVFDLQVVLREAHDSVSNKAERRGLALSWFMPPHMPLLYIGNPTQLQNVLRLLLDSAIESTYRGSVQIAVRRVPDSTNPGHLVFTVTDTGQTSPSLRRSTTALMRAWEMVTADGGALSLDSAPNHGTIVSFTLHLKVPGKQTQNLLPVYTDAHGVDGEAYANQDNILYPGLQPNNNSLSLTHLQPFSLLVADEQTTNRQLLSFFLNDLPYSIEEAKTVKEAISLYAEAPVGLVIFDSTLTDLDLGTAIKTVHDIDASLNIPPVPIVALVQNHADVASAMELGAAAAIRKPLSRGKVRDIVTRLLPIPEEVLKAMQPKAEPILIQETELEEDETQITQQDIAEQNNAVTEQTENRDIEAEAAMQGAGEEKNTQANDDAETLTLDPVEGIISTSDQEDESIELQPWKTEEKAQGLSLTSTPENEPELQVQNTGDPLSIKPEDMEKHTGAASADGERAEGGLSLAAAARRFMRIRRKPMQEHIAPTTYPEDLEDGTVSAPRPVGSFSGKTAAPREPLWANTKASAQIDNEPLTNNLFCNEPASSSQDLSLHLGQTDGEASAQLSPPWFSRPNPSPEPEEAFETSSSMNNNASHAKTFEQNDYPAQFEQEAHLNWGSGESVSEPRPIIKKEDQPPARTAPIAGTGDDLDPEVIHLIPGLLDSLDMALNDAYTGLENSSFLTVAEACMRISGTADAHGLRVLKGIANCVERAANANDLDAVTDLLAELDSSVQNNRKKLEKIYDSHTS